MNPTNDNRQTRLMEALRAEDPSLRLQAALAAGSNPDLALMDTLVVRCGAEPDFFVREMLSWALTRLPSEVTLPRVRQELESSQPQARSQALHTMSKINEKDTWPWITREMLRDSDDDVARTAWRVAVVLVPDDMRADLAEELTSQLGRGDQSVQLSLSRALVDLGEASIPAVAKALRGPDVDVMAHARVTELLRLNSQLRFEEALKDARRDAYLDSPPSRSAAAVVGEAPC